MSTLINFIVSVLRIATLVLIEDVKCKFVVFIVLVLTYWLVFSEWFRIIMWSQWTIQYVRYSMSKNMCR